MDFLSPISPLFCSNFLLFLLYKGDYGFLGNISPALISFEPLIPSQEVTGVGAVCWGRLSHLSMEHN